ncbi:flagellar basal body rod protein FlgC [Caballeronia pedi]|uniref:Flagellar basal-body rod protein FlgC n=1 Tax=Caballeronia pedi TaxID=1777141 RepID=A0A158C0K1_9BURK|nr:flagellar basal body rod protein FlgC [Caballeronia pedi]SAK75843.1 flagellar basal body rod protein FlgC [Caballeronia pedi]
MSNAIFAIARSGMDVEHQRMEVIAQNLANAGTTRTASGGVYRPMRLVSGPRMPGASETSFDTQMSAMAPSDLSRNFSGVQAFGIETTDAQPRLVYDPAHPHANAQGFVQYPGLDQAGEMALMVQTLRVYEANAIMFNAGHAMYMRALDLGSKA